MSVYSTSPKLKFKSEFYIKRKKSLINIIFQIQLNMLQKCGKYFSLRLQVRVREGEVISLLI